MPPGYLKNASCANHAMQACKSEESVGCEPVASCARGPHTYAHTESYRWRETEREGDIEIGLEMEMDMKIEMQIEI